MKGYFGSYLDVDLTSGKLGEYVIPEDWQEKYLGGRGIAARILAEEMEANVDPLSPNNIMVFATGPFQGLGIPGAGRHLLMSKSPKTEAVNGSYVGGFFGEKLGKSGYDGIIIRGSADDPLYLVLKDGSASLKDGSDLWGSATAETEKEIKEREGEVSVTSIGIAGENQVKFSCVMNDRNRAAGRPGFGAVLGSKKLKAIAVGGGRKKEMEDEEKFESLRAEYARVLAENKRDGFGKYGTAGGLTTLNEMGILPTKNFQEGEFEEAEKIGGEEMYDTVLNKRDSCASCPIRCKRVVETEFKGEEVNPEYGGPEYETLAALGSMCLNSDLDSISLANQRCNKYGLDTISAGVTIAFAMEASEKGLLEEDIEWGDGEAVVDLLDKIAHREGLGNYLAEGIDELAEDMGADFAMEIKGQEIPMHEPRGKKGLGLTYAVTPRGANHMETVHDTMLESEPLAPELGVEEPKDRNAFEDKGRIAKIFEDLTSFNNSLVMCLFTVDMVGENYSFDHLREMLETVTGRELDEKEMLRIGERNFILLRLLGAREGYTSEDDRLPKRFSQPLPEGGSEGEAITEEDLQKMMEEYYELRGYDHHGPTEEKLQELGLEDFADFVSRG